MNQMIVIVITHKRVDAQGVILELKDDRNVVYTSQQIIKMLNEDVPIKMPSKKILTTDDIKEDLFNELPVFYYRPDTLKPCQYL